MNRPLHASTITCLFGTGSATRICFLTSCILLLATLANVSRAQDSIDTASRDRSFEYSLAPKDLETDWRVTGCRIEQTDAGWRLAEGDGFVHLPHRLNDFELSFEFRPEKDEGWDSGLYFRCELPSGKSPWPKRYQVNLREGQEGRLLGIPDADVSQELVRVGDWNQLRIRVIGKRASLWMNGTLAWEVDSLEPLSGYVGIQSEVPLGGSFEFRDFVVREIGSQSMFDGESLEGWTPVDGNKNESWQVDSQQLICTGAKGSWLRFDEQQGNFNMRLEYQLREAGNSGVYIRVPADGNHHGPQSGIEVQILDDAAERYSELKPYQYSGSLYAIVPAKPRVSRAAGQWNQLEIDAQGKSYRVWHNGQLIIDAEAANVDALNERRK